MKKLLCVAALFSLAACTQAPPATVDTTAADLKAVVDTAKAAEQAWTAKNIDGVMAQYAPDATLVVPGAPVTKGADGIRGMLGELLKDPNLALTMEVANTEVSGGLAYQRGTYTLQVTDGKTKKQITEKGSALIIYKKQADGTWKVVEDFNTALPAAQP
jgi:uncharacterized protein (TIGR02246 family)